MADLSMRSVEVRAASLASMDCLRSAKIFSVNIPVRISLVHGQREQDPIVGDAGAFDEEVAAFGNFDRALDERSFTGCPLDFEFMDFLVGGFRSDEHDEALAEIETV